MSEFLGHYGCIKCSSSNALALYQDDEGYNAFCFSCSTDFQHNEISESYLGDEFGIDGKKPGKGQRKPGKKKERSNISEEEKQHIHSITTYKGSGYRKIKDEYNKYFGVRSEYDENTAKIVKRHYPVTTVSKENKNIILTGYKTRVISDKSFLLTGKNTKECDFFGQWKCKGGKYLLITGGEEDAIAAYQMLREDQIRRKKDSLPAIDVISSSIGETSAANQAKYHYDLFERYEVVVLNMDEDEAGEKAIKQLLDAIPAENVRVMKCPAKDACKALEDGLEKEFVNSFYKARKPKIAGIVAGDEMWKEMIKSVAAPLIPLPEMLKPLEEKLCGGLPCGEIVNILAASGIGKTSITNNLILYWIFNCPYKVGVLSMEAGAGKFLVRLVSGYLNKNIARLESTSDKIKFLEEHREKCEDLFIDEEGDERFYLVDDKGDLDSLEAIKKTVESMIKKGGCKVIIIDPIQDALDSLSIEDQAAFVGWQKKIKARDDVTFININHTRKSGGGHTAGSRGGELTEEDMQGTSALYKSGAVNIILTRDKTAEDPLERNTTKVILYKARDTGDTGPAGEIYYEMETSVLHNKDEWMRENGEMFSQ